MGDEVRQALHRVLTANQATGGPLTEAGEGDLLTSLRALNKLCANTKGWQADAVLKAETLSVLSAAVLSPRYSAEVRGHAAGVVALVVNHDKQVTLSEQLAECLVAMVASDHRLAQKKAIKAIHNTQYANQQNGNLLVAKGVIEALARLISNTPFLATNWMRFRWACGALGLNFKNKAECIHRIAACDNLLHTMIELLKVRSSNYGYAKCSVSLYFQELARSGEGALVMVEHKLPHAMKTFINSAPHSLFSSRFQFAALMSLLKQDVALHALIHEQCLATAWRYLLYHAKHSPDKKERVTMLQLYTEAIVVQRSKVKLLARASVGATTGDAQSGLDALLAFVFMSPDREEKTQMLLDRCGLDALFKALANDSSALNVLTALNCLTLGDAQVYEQSGVSPPTLLLPRPSVPAAVPVLAPRAAALVTVFPPAAAVVAPDPRIPQPVRRTITQSGCFAQWRADRALHDVAFRFPSEGGVTVTAHKLLLAGKSPVFKAMFTSGMREARRGGAGDDENNDDADGLPVVAIPNIASRIFQLLLDFCYGVHLLEPPSPVATTATTAPDPQRAILNTLDAMAAWLNHAGASPDEVAALLAAAGQYEILDLEDGCAHFLGARLSGSNVMDMLRLGLMHRSPVLVFRCFELVLSDPSVVLLKRAGAKTTTKLVTRKKSPSRAAAAPTQATTYNEQAKKSEDEDGGEDGDEDESEMEIEGTSRGNTADEPCGAAAAPAEEPVMIQQTRWVWRPKARQVLLGESECRAMLRDFVLRGMADVPQLEFVASGDASASPAGPGVGLRAKDSKNCLLQ